MALDQPQTQHTEEMDFYEAPNKAVDGDIAAEAIRDEYLDYTAEGMELDTLR